MAEKKWNRAVDEAKRLARNVPGIRGVDFGWGYKKGTRKRRLCVRFHVENKRPESEIAAHQLLPKQVSGIPTDVVVARYEPHASSIENVDPLQPGVSIGNLDRGASGTLGGFVTDTASHRRGLISNWHVFCGGREAKIGDTICQPSPYHAASQIARRVGALERWTNLAVGYDAALALLDPATLLNENVFDLGITVAGVEEPKLGMRLVKYGVTSKATSGIIDGVQGAYPVDYSGWGDESRWMDGFRLVREEGPGPSEISLRGDSGALWINPLTKKAVGLHFGGEDGLGPLAEYALAHPINRALELLGATLP
jgi:hypothetical protein